jgi:hypothetical protein
MPTQSEIQKTASMWYRTALKVETQNEADILFAKLVDYHVTQFSTSHTRAVEQIADNLVYISGHADATTYRRVFKLFKLDERRSQAESNKPAKAEMETGK